MCVFKCVCVFQMTSQMLQSICSTQDHDRLSSACLVLIPSSIHLVLQVCHTDFKLLLPRLSKIKTGAALVTKTGEHKKILTRRGT